MAVETDQTWPRIAGATQRGVADPSTEPASRPTDLAGGATGIVLSVCTRCRDGREAAYADRRGGARFADRLIDAIGERRGALPPFHLRGVACMSQCKRPCVIALTAPRRYTFVFGDLDPFNHADAVLDLLPLYAADPQGRMPRPHRPAPLQAGILGRIPPLDATGDAVQPLLTVDPTTA